MRKLWFLLLIPVCALVASSLCVQSAQAAMIPVGLKSLTGTSDNILRGVVMDKHSYWDANHVGIYTDIRIEVQEEYKGAVGSGEVLLTVQGGEVGDTGLRVSDVPDFQGGEDVILFLVKRGDRYFLNAKQFGKYTIIDGTIVEKGVAADKFINRLRSTIREIRR